MKVKQGRLKKAIEAEMHVSLEKETTEEEEASNAASIVYKTLASLLSEKRDLPYSITLA